MKVANKQRRPFEGFLPKWRGDPTTSEFPCLLVPYLAPSTFLVPIPDERTMIEAISKKMRRGQEARKGGGTCIAEKRPSSESTCCAPR
jgi:hypothetical protein